MKNTDLNFGILAPISWNSKKWQDDPTKQDLELSEYGYGKENYEMLESLNFGNEIYPTEKGGTYIAYTPTFNTLPNIEDTIYVSIVFFVSTDYHQNGASRIVGFYGLPKIDNFYRKSKHEMYKKYNFGNVKSSVEDIVLFDNYLTIDEDIIRKKHLLPQRRKLEKEGNYLTHHNVYNILEMALHINPNHQKLGSFFVKLNIWK
jgi:hypothetical protein